MRKLHEMYLSIAVWMQVCSESVKRVTAALLMLLVSQQAFAQQATQISDFAANWETEANAIVPVVLLIIAAIGIIIAGTAILSGVSAKRNRQPLEWQVWGVIGGAAVTVVPVIILAMSGSLTSQTGKGAEVMNSLGL